MMKEIIRTEKAPAAIGPYSQAVKYGNLVFTSGSLGIDPVTGIFVEGGVQAQTKQCLENVKVILEASGSKLENVLKTTVFIKDMNDFSKVNEIYGQYFTDNQPGRSCVEVARLPKDALVEIEVIAYIG
ncbi:MAG TPA: RidA family protein [Bacillota bacterium]|nr:RidA family protein [Bacillota bacterium]HPL52900.1 RidA family protein [Bacillota bacterium]